VEKVHCSIDESHNSSAWFFDCEYGTRRRKDKVSSEYKSWITDIYAFLDVQKSSGVLQRKLAGGQRWILQFGDWRDPEVQDSSYS